MPKRTRLYEEHKKLGGKIVDFAGWEMPIQYEGITEEHLAVRKAAGIFDVSHMGVFEISGKNVCEFLDYLTPSDNTNLSVGQAQYSLLLTDAGTFVDDIILYKLSPDKFFVVVNASNLEKDFQWIKDHIKGDVELKNLSSNYTLIALQGPRAANILSKLTSADLSSIKTFHLATVDIKGIGDILIARTGYTGEDGFEIFAPAASATKVWNMLLETGKSDGLRPIGLAARDTLRLEMKYSLYGHEINNETNALEANLRWVIKFKKPSNFIGRKTLEKIRDEGLTRKLIGFKMIDKGIPRQGYPIKASGKAVGFVTSGTFSPSLNEPIGIGYVEMDLSEIGSKFFIDIRGKERLAEVVKTPFYNKV